MRQIDKMIISIYLLNLNDLFTLLYTILHIYTGQDCSDKWYIAMLSHPSVSISGCSGDGRGGRRDDAGDWAPRHNSWLLTRERGGCVLVPRTRGETLLY